jgi:predicted porin
MKKSLIALAVMAAAGAASAQSSVTLFGILDATLAHGHANGANKTALANSGYNSSRIGFRGQEDLGGGMAASFWLEGSLGNDDGSAGQRIPVGNQNALNGGIAADGAGLVFNRRSTVSLSGNWGEVRLGRDYTPTFWNLTVFDPFGTNGVGTTLTFNGPGSGLGVGGKANTFAPQGTRNVISRASNDIGYFLPANLGGIYGQANFWLGENNQTGVGTESDGQGWGVRVGYGAGPLNAAISYAKTRYDQSDAVSGGDYTTWNVGGQWDFGVAKAMAQFTRDRKEDLATGRGWLIGALVPVGVGEIRASYSTYKIDFGGGVEPRSNQIALGYVHNLSKRTALYATVAHVKNKDGAALTLNGATGIGANFNSTGYDLGIRHSF